MSFLHLSLAALLAVSSATSPCVAATNTTTGSNSTSGTVASTYFAGYHANRGFPVSSMPWEKYTDVKYAFAETSEDGSLNLTKSAPDQLPVFVSAAKEKGVKALVSIGGWTGSRFFSSSIGSAENRTAFVKTCLDLVGKYNLDGLDFDWEYPNRQGLGCNTINANDTSNFLLFLQELRQKQTKTLYLTAATSLNPWNDALGAQSTSLSGFASSLDYLMVMGYDIYGAWAATGGPNAPLAFTCDSRNNQGGITESMTKWIATGVPASKLVLAVGAYGHGFSVNTTNAFPDGKNGSLTAYPVQNSTNRFQGSSWDDDPRIDDCGAASPPSGTYPFWSLIKEAGILAEDGSVRSGIVSGFDNCSMTPFAYNETAQVWVSYDDVRSLTAKGQYVKSTGLAGFAMWEAGGDFNNILVNAIRSAVGL